MTAVLTPTIPLESADAKSRDRTIWLATTAIVFVLFLLLENRYWIPGGDSEVYVASARSIVLGQGYMFNGQAAKIALPGWPLLLAAMMKFVSPTFVALKLMTLLSMVAALSVYYRVLRRFASPELSSAMILLTAIISHVYSVTFWLHSEALFTLVTALTILVCQQINEGRRQAWRIALLMLLCILAPFIRYAGIINLVVICGALLAGELKPAKNRKWIIFACAVVITIGSYFAIRAMVNYYAPPRVPFEASAQVDQSALVNDLAAVTSDSVSQMPDALTGMRGQTGFITRFLGFGTWFSYLLWQPLRLAAGVKLIWIVATIVGWIVGAVVLVCAIDESRSRRWLLPSVAMSTIAFGIYWPQATARYLVPITPLVLLMIVLGVRLLTSRASSAAQKSFVRWMGIVGFASVVLCNLALYEEELRVMRSSHFADRYEAGLNKSLIAAAEYLNDMHVGNWQVCVNPKYFNVNKHRTSPAGMRVLAMLTGKATLQLPMPRWKELKSPNDREFRKLFVAKNRIAYYLEQPEISPWRVWHYRMAWLQERVTGLPAIDTGAGWKLYRCNGAETPVEIALPDVKHYPTRVPGL